MEGREAKLYQLVRPMKWRAGCTSGDRTKAIYFECGRCAERDAVIHGFVATEPRFDKVVVLGTADRGYRLALLCEKCFREVEGGAPLVKPKPEAPKMRPTFEVVGGLRF